MCFVISELYRSLGGGRLPLYLFECHPKPRRHCRPNSTPNQHCHPNPHHCRFVYGVCKVRPLPNQPAHLFTLGSSTFRLARYAVEDTEQPEEKHGGFVRAAMASVVKGLAREPITGCLPLFINEEHWRVAKHKMKPIMGYH